ncbi:MAG: UDP-N-acetylglucosamine 2-epimerase (non-hydrolyzing), partial [Ignavibacterium sp.]|nr:UDP-N-acetylglucosamine 2-epimerase (non-hydrolyzing) [Ignavibacterium sp.]
YMQGKNGKILVITGTRPEIIKMAPIIRVLQKNDVPFSHAHIGQHYDYNMSQQFIEELGLPSPEYFLKVKRNSPSLQTSHIIGLTQKLIKRIKPSLVLVEGDTNTVLASSLAALKQKIPVGHVEAGLRSHDLRMPEEHNRRLVDHLSAYLYAPTMLAKMNLEFENVWGKIFVTGNTVVDAVMQHMPLAEAKSNIIDKIYFDEYALATLHRQENVDDFYTLRSLVKAFVNSPIPIVYPVHPRSLKRLQETKLWSLLFTSNNVQMLPPVGYLDFLVLLKNSRMVITDSGGVQEEATAPLMRKPVLVTRISTERPEAIKTGFAFVVGTESENITKMINYLLENTFNPPSFSPFGDGKAAERIVNAIMDELVNTTFERL